jgi:peptidoglycan/xylan/chitin deacetylase (PgdA/CDA1 family)
MLLHVVRALGFFALARRVSRRRLRILCYHGLSIGDQHEYAPVMFMRPEVFERRLQHLKRLNYPIIPLSEAVGKLRSGDIRNGEVVITIDDGWKSTATIAAPFLAKHRFPASLYLTTYYVERNDDVFNVVVQYMFWRTRRATISVAGVAAALDGEYQVKGNEAALVDQWVTFGARYCDAPGRQELLRTLARQLELDFERVIEARRFTLIDRDDVRKLIESGIDIQLHTHRHTFPSDALAAAKEISENREALERLGAGAGVHFCYPSGRYSPDHPQLLAQLGVSSATTCDVGSNAAGDSLFLLKRYLDRDDAEDIEFESELSGFADFLRGLRGNVGRPQETPQ